MNKKAKGNFGMFLIILVLLGLVFYFFIYEDGIHSPYNDNLEDPYINQINGCINSGGNIKLSSCCLSVGDFPNSCSVGSCGCSPFYSHQVRTCYCSQDKCWNGNTCQDWNTDKPLINAHICNSAGGHWNNCGSICQIMNQGKEVACPTSCGELCECGTIIGLGCPDGYECITPTGISDAMGYCDNRIRY